jgi:adenylate cyclase class IV
VSRNVELKARDADPAATLARAHAAGAVEADVLEQRDTYFAVPNGRLKLREERGGAATLVAYNRTNSTDTRVSDYELVAVHDPPALARVLSLVLGIRTVVEKRRRLLMWEDTVRVHLDDVRGLGTSSRSRRSRSRARTSPTSTTRWHASPRLWESTG